MSYGLYWIVLRDSVQITKLKNLVMNMLNHYIYTAEMDFLSPPIALTMNSVPTEVFIETHLGNIVQVILDKSWFCQQPYLLSSIRCSPPSVT